MRPRSFSPATALNSASKAHIGVAVFPGLTIYLWYWRPDATMAFVTLTGALVVVSTLVCSGLFLWSVLRKEHRRIIYRSLVRFAVGHTLFVLQSIFLVYVWNPQ